MEKHITNAAGETIVSTMNEDCLRCIDSCKTNNEVFTNCPVYFNKRRRGVFKSDLGMVYICCHEEDLVKSSRLFKEKLAVYAEMFPEIEKIKTSITDDIIKDTKRLIHNLTSLNAHNIQELYSLVPQDILTQNYKDQLSVIKNVILNNLEETAKMYIRIAKNNAAVKTEFSVFKKLFEPVPTLNPKRHFVRKVLMNVLHTFFQDFSDQGIYVDVKDSANQLQFDYESIHVALYHILENAAKYVAPNSRIVISFDRKTAYSDIIFNMLSLKIEPEEVTMILDEGYIGKMAKKLNRFGSGIGLNHVKRILDLNNCKIIIQNNIKPDNNKTISGVKYEQNTFILRFDLLHSLKLQQA